MQRITDETFRMATAINPYSMTVPLLPSADV
jgi:hypothetical protein